MDWHYYLAGCCICSRLRFFMADGYFMKEPEYTCSHNQERNETGMCEDCEWFYRIQCSGIEDFCDRSEAPPGIFTKDEEI